MKTRANQQQGSVLVIVLWIAFGLISIALYFGHSMLFELRASDNRVATAEADQAIAGAARYIAYILSTQTNGAAPNDSYYQHEAVKVGDATFWLIGRNYTNSVVSEKVTFGLIDEASKINLNAISGLMLTNLPNMTPDLAAAISDWRTSSTTASYYGAKDETYNMLNPPYLCKKASYETVDELSMVYGMDSDLLYGEDANLNGILDPNENDGETEEPYDNRNGTLDPGFFEYFTVYSRESTNRLDGTAKININQTSQLSQLRQILQDRISGRANQIAAVVQSRISSPQQQGGGGGRGGSPQPPAQPTPFTSLMDFYVSTRAAGMTAEDFALIASDITITNAVQRLININTASEAVLSCIPGIGTNYAATVVAYRESNLTPDQEGSVAWLVDAIGQGPAMQAGRYITAYSYQFTADVAAVGHYGHGYKRVKFVFDISDSITGLSAPRIVYRQDLTHLGWALGKEVRQNLELELTKNNQ